MKWHHIPAKKSTIKEQLDSMNLLPMHSFKLYLQGNKAFFYVHFWRQLCNEISNFLNSHERKICHFKGWSCLVLIYNLNTACGFLENFNLIFDHALFKQTLSNIFLTGPILKLQLVSFCQTYQDSDKFLENIIILTSCRRKNISPMQAGRHLTRVRLASMQEVNTRSQFYHESTQSNTLLIECEIILIQRNTGTKIVAMNLSMIFCESFVNDQ